MKHHVVPTCKTCGSTNIVRDAFAEWDQTTQNWVLRTVFDDILCDDCSSTSIEDVPVLTRAEHAKLPADNNGYTEVSIWLLPPDNLDHQQIHDQIPGASRTVLYPTSDPLLVVSVQLFQRNI